MLKNEYIETLAENLILSSLKYSFYAELKVARSS